MSMIADLLVVFIKHGIPKGCLALAWQSGLYVTMSPANHSCLIAGVSTG
ncbi:MAG: hypothetical protein VX435_12375 [Planctomycetota bacterium]|nr:hypothetical protein [Planctomycetota bacterium]